MHAVPWHGRPARVLQPWPRTHGRAAHATAENAPLAMILAGIPLRVFLCAFAPLRSPLFSSDFVIWASDLIRVSGIRISDFFKEPAIKNAPNFILHAARRLLHFRLVNFSTR